QHVDLLLLDQPHGLIDGDVRLALGVGVDRLELVALDAALLDEVVDHDLRAERVKLGAAAGERARVVVDDADLELLGLRGSIGGKRHTENQGRDDHTAHEAGQSIVTHGISSSCTAWGWACVCAGITSRSVNICQGSWGAPASLTLFPPPVVRA